MALEGVKKRKAKSVEVSKAVGRVKGRYTCLGRSSVRRGPHKHPPCDYPTASICFLTAALALKAFRSSSPVIVPCRGWVTISRGVVSGLEFCYVGRAVDLIFLSQGNGINGCSVRTRSLWNLIWHEMQGMCICWLIWGRQASYAASVARRKTRGWFGIRGLTSSLAAFPVS